LVSAYESGLYGIQRMLSTNGYEQRRQAALAEVQSTKVKAAAAASAIALVQIKLIAGQSTDGAVFFPHEGKALSGGRLVVNTNTDTFAFKPE
jgi:L-asparagine transporter-like permease